MQHAADNSVGFVILWFHLGAGAVGILIHFGLLLWERYHKPTGKKKKLSYSERLRGRFSGSSPARRENLSKRKQPRK